MGRTGLADEILAKLRERFPEALSRTVLSWSVKVDEAQSHGRTIFEYDPDCNGAEDYANVAKFFLGIEEAVQETPQAAPPIEIREVNLPVPQHDTPVPICTEPAAPAAADPGQPSPQGDIPVSNPQP